MRPSSVVDLFCGVGGLTRGFVDEGFDVVAGLDSDGSCRYAYERNNGARFIEAKIEDFSAADILALYPPDHLKILVGCAPCQPFSSYTKKQPKDESKWGLVSAFAARIEKVEPDIVSMENVPQLENFNNGEVFSGFVKRLMKMEYHVTQYVIYCPEYGIPQKRTRLVLLASRRGEIKLVGEKRDSSQYVTVKETIGHLPPIEAGEAWEGDPLHKARGLSELNLRRIKQSVPGGTWRDWDNELIAACHKKKTGESYASVYGRMAWNEPAPTITTECYNYGSGRFGHPEQDRPISLREAALLQTFPPDYEFVAPNQVAHFETVGRHIGNAVPVGLGQLIAKSIKQHLEEYNG